MEMETTQVFAPGGVKNETVVEQEVGWKLFFSLIVIRQ